MAPQAQIAKRMSHVHWTQESGHTCCMPHRAYIPSLQLEYGVSWYAIYSYQYSSPFLHKSSSDNSIHHMFIENQLWVEWMVCWHMLVNTIPWMHVDHEPCTTYHHCASSESEMPWALLLSDSLLWPLPCWKHCWQERCHWVQWHNQSTFCLSWFQKMKQHSKWYQIRSFTGHRYYRPSFMLWQSIWAYNAPQPNQVSLIYRLPVLSLHLHWCKGKRIK